MAQIFSHKPHDKVNYAVGGNRLLIRDTNENAGFLYVGSLVSANIVQAIEVAEHFVVSAGKKAKDINLITGTSIKFDFTAEEMLLLNLRRFFLAAAHTDIAANAVATAAAETFIAGKTNIHHGLKYGQQTAAQRTALIVYNVTDAAALVSGTDFDVITIHGWTFIRMKVDTHSGDTIRAGTGATATAVYTFNQLAAKEFSPHTKLTFNLEAILQFPAAQGPNMQWRIPSAQILPAGNLNWSSTEASNKQFSMEILDDSANNPTFPLGKIEYYGYDDAGAALI